MPQLERLLEIIWSEVESTKFVPKLDAATGLVSNILLAIFSQDHFRGIEVLDNFCYFKKIGGLALVENLLIHEFPMISQQMSEKFFNF